MTREEAIKIFNTVLFFGKCDCPKEEIEECLKMAIKALEHPERNVIAVVPCGDAISRSDVLKPMQDNWHTHNGDWAMQESMDDIRALPSVTPISKDCADCIAEDKTFMKMDRIKQLLNSDKLDDLEVLKKIREVVEE